MKIIGLTGGIASGKSTVSRMLKDLGCIIIDADIISREVVEPGSSTLKKIVEIFGDTILNSDGTLNRKVLGDIVFSDRGKLCCLNSIIHPAIKDTIIDRIDECRRNDENSIVIVDAAVLLESRMDDIVDEVWLVYVNPSVQKQRLVKRDNLGIIEAETRIESQMSVEEKIKRSNRIIDNSGDIKHTEDQVMKLWIDINK